MTIVQANRGDDIDSVSSGTQDEATNFYSNQSPEGEEKKSVTDEDGTDGSYSKALEDEFGEFMAKAEVELVPKDSERIAATKMFADMRAEGTFCDVTFSVRGILYRAHSVIICAWSRYLRSVILTKEEARGATRMNVQSMDAARISVIEWTLPSIFLDFKPEAFGAVLDYIYGFPIKLTVENAESIIQVVRRLEMLALEQQIWYFLMNIIDETNCERLHDLADRYDCPPLKLTAWRIIQEAVPGYAMSPGDVLNMSLTFSMNDHGLTGPGEPHWIQGYTGSEHGLENDEDEQLEVLSIFDPYREGGEEGSEGSPKRTYDFWIEETQSFLHPKELPKGTPAVDVVRCWAAHLQRVHLACVPDDTEGMEAEGISYVPSQKKGIWKKPKAAGEAKKMKAADRVGAAAKAAASFVAQQQQQQQQQQHHHQMHKLSGHSIESLNAHNLHNTSTSASAAAAFKSDPMRKPVADIDWKGELRRLYLAIHQPQKVAQLDEILRVWVGREDAMLSSLLVKYRKQIPPELYDHLDQLHTLVETRSQSSFVDSRIKNR